MSFGGTGISSSGYYAGGGGGACEHGHDDFAAYVAKGVPTTGVLPPLFEGLGAERLGLGGSLADAETLKVLVDQLQDPETGKQLGQKPGKYSTEEEIVARLIEGLGYSPEPEELARLEVQAHKKAQHAIHATDWGLGVHKSVSVLHAALQDAGDYESARIIWECIDTGADKVIERINELTMMRPSAHGGQSINGSVTTKYVQGGESLFVRFRHQESRDGEPQLHIHLMQLHRVYDPTTKTWRAPALAAVYKEVAGINALFMRSVEAEIHRRLGYTFATRPDGKSREILGITEEVRDFFSSRTRALTAVVERKVADWKAKTGRAPSKWLTYKMTRDASLATRKAKRKVVPEREVDLASWDKGLRDKIHTSFKDILRGATMFRSPGAQEHVDRAKVIAQALATLDQRKQKWRHGELIDEIARALPDTLGLDADGVQVLLDDLVAEALRNDEVINLSAPTLIDVPPELQRSDGSCVFDLPKFERYSSLAQLQTESGLVDGLRWKGARSMSVELANEYLDRYPTLDAGQRAMVFGLLTDGKFMGLVSAAAGSGKTYAISVYREILREHSGAVAFGISNSQNAVEVLRDEGFERCANAHQVLSYYARVRDGKKVGKKETEKYALPKGSVWVVDESSMLDTAQASELAALARQHQWKIVFVGDPNQLDAVGPAGAFNLLCEKGTAYELTEVHRQEEQWERDATLGIRAGEVEPLVEYDRRGRLVGGDAEVMKTQAYENFLADHLNGIDSLLIVGSNKEAAEASSRVHEDLVRLGLINDDIVLTLRHDIRAGVGALITTRRNKWDMREPGTDETYHLINREVWRITDAYENGSAYAIKVLGRDEQGNELHGERRFLPPWYVREHVDLAYASTVHAAQGRTVQNMHVVVDEMMDRYGFYVAMSRGKLENRAYVVTKQLEPARHGKPEMREHYMDRLASLVDREGDRLSATQFLEREQARSEHLGNLGARWTILITDHRFDTYTELFRRALDAHTFARYEQDSATANLHRLLAAMELRGADAQQIVTRIVTSRELDTADSVSQVLIGRAKKLNDDHRTHQRTREFVRHTFAERTPSGGGATMDYARAVAEFMDARSLELAEIAAADPPAYLAKLGPVPAEPVSRAEWLNRAACIEAYRQQYNVKSDDPIGLAPSWHEPEKRASYDQCSDALGLDPTERDMKGMSVGRLHNLVAEWDAEKSWLPRNVDKELKTAGLAVREATTRLTLAKARSDHSGDGQQVLDAADVLRRMEDRLAAFKFAADARQRAYEVTTERRERANAATEELRLRGALDDQPATVGGPQTHGDTDVQIANDLRRARAAIELLDNRAVDVEYEQRQEHHEQRHPEESHDHGIEH